jgi:predicted NBD/HSP70 family sugar kinase
MDALGLHLTRRGVRAVLVDGNGHVMAAAFSEQADLSPAMQDALRRAAPDRSDLPVGLAVDPVDSIDTAAATAVLEREGYRGSTQIVSAGGAAVSAEIWTGAAGGARHAICLWVGETVLAGIVLDGRLWRGAHGMAGAAAWLALNPVERQDYRKFGSLAAEVSNKGIARRLAWRIQAGDHSSVLERAGDLDAITAAHVFEGARLGDGVSISVVRDTAKYIGMAIANLSSAIDPEIVVIAGPAAAYGDLLIEPVRQECVRRLPPALAGRFRCEMSPLGDDGVAIGAARLASDDRGTPFPANPS